jgi:hypothetical protein
MALKQTRRAIRWPSSVLPVHPRRARAIFSEKSGKKFKAEEGGQTRLEESSLCLEQCQERDLTGSITLRG